MKKRALAVLLTAVLAFSLAACGSTAGTSGETEAPKQEAPKEAAPEGSGQSGEKQEESKPTPVIYFVGPRTGGLYWNQAKEGFEAGCAALGLEPLFVAPTEPFNTSQQVDLMNTAMTNGANIVLAVVGEPKVFGAICSQLKGAGITVGSIASPSEEVSFNVGPTYANRAIAYCDEINKLSGDGTQLNILFLSTAAGSFSDIYQSTVEEWCAKRGNAKLVLMDFVEGDTIKGSDKLAAALRAYPEINAVICPDSTGSMGVASYIKENGLADQLYVVAEGNSGDILNMTIEGYIDVDVYWEAYDMGYDAVAKAVDMYYGKEVPFESCPDYSRIDASNAEQYAKERGISLTGN